MLRYGDVAGCRRALNAAIFEQPALAVAELAPPGPLPNAGRLLAVTQSAELNALQAAHSGKLPDAFSVARRHLWETRLSGHLTDEREALELFGDVLLAARRPAVVRVASTGVSYALTTGTGSGKSLTYIVPIVDRVLREGSGRGVRAIVVYPMNALANSQLEELSKFLKYGYGEAALLRETRRPTRGGQAWSAAARVRIVRQLANEIMPLQLCADPEIHGVGVGLVHHRKRATLGARRRPTRVTPMRSDCTCPAESHG